MTDRWSINPKSKGIIWQVAADESLPHSDHIEMSGRKVSVIVRYAVDAERRLTLERDIIWPTLRTREGDTRGYTRRQYVKSAISELTVNDEPFQPGPVATIQIRDGLFVVSYKPSLGLEALQILFPSTTERSVVERWIFHNTGGDTVVISLPPRATFESMTGVYGEYRVSARTFGIETSIPPGQGAGLVTIYRARRMDETEDEIDVDEEHEKRVDRFTSLAETLVLETPDPVLNQAFEFAKFHTAECLFETKMGLVHSPTGGSYYGGIWANDQAEYSGPFFGYLGDPAADEAALNAYRIYAAAMKPDFSPVPTSFEMEGTIPYHAGGGDRGDAAMIASGLTRYLLFRGDRERAEELWPAVAWCLEFCRRKTNADGVVASNTDELERRFPTGETNLSTSSLAYDGLRNAAHLARSLGKNAEAAEFDSRAENLAAAIERHFGATVAGYPTYRYYEGNTTLRSWIALPLTVGLLNRAEGTIAALFSPDLWTPDGLATEAGDKVFWDRATLYALRGVFRAGATEIALRYLKDYSQRRLLGEHVPYPVEAYPEGGQAHLSAESALYCRIFVEGLLGIEPTGLRSFRLTPRLPESWNRVTLSLPAFGQVVDIAVRAVDSDTVNVRCTGADGLVFLDATAPRDSAIDVALPE